MSNIESVDKYLGYPILKRGSNNSAVTQVKAILRSQGFWSGSASQVFGPKMEAAVRYFQGTHLRPDGVFLKGDGVIGPMTWWALNNPSGAAQRSNINGPDQIAQSGDTSPFDQKYGRLSEKRQKFLRVLFDQYAQGVREIPDGSNQGDGVDKYIVGYGPVYWCALFVSWCYNAAFGSWPKNSREAGVRRWWNKAVAGNYAYKAKSSYKPVPGDLALWGFSGGAGHITTVVTVSDDGNIFNSIGGNEGNRVKLGLRYRLEEPALLGFVDLFGDGPTSGSIYTGGLLEAGKTPNMSQGGTR
jgi:hypothetical protein